MISESQYIRDAIVQYIRDGKLNSTLTMNAGLANCHYEWEGNGNHDSIRQEFRQLFADFKKELQQIWQDVLAIELAAKQWEIKYWFDGRGEVMTDQELNERMWRSIEKDYVKQPPRGLQKLVRDSKYAGFSGKHSSYKAMMLASAGRVMVTINGGKKLKQASYTMVLDETADWTRGGMQSLSGTKDEVVGLLEFAIANPVSFEHDEKVFFG